MIVKKNKEFIFYEKKYFKGEIVNYNKIFIIISNKNI